MRASFLGFVVFIATEASVAAVSREPAFDEAELLSGRVLNLAASHDVPTHDEVFALDGEMRAFVAPVKALRTPQQKMQALIRGLEEHGMFSLDYAETLKAWRANFDRACAEGRLPAGFDERFCNLWRFYLMYCEGGFRGGGIVVSQVTLVKAA